MNKLLLGAASLSVILAGGLQAHLSTAAQSGEQPLTLQAASPAKANPSVARINEQVFTREKGIVGEQKYIIRFEDEPLATYDGRVPGLKATRASSAKTSLNSKKARLNARSAESQAYLDYLAQRHTEMRSRMENRVGRALSVKRQYRSAINGMTVRMTQDEAAQVASLRGVAKIQRDLESFPTTDRGPTYIGATTIWEGGIDGIEAKGEGIVLGIMDSGIHGDHPSFAEVASDGYVHTNPLGDGVFLGECDPGSPLFNADVDCNNKLIGRYLFIDSTPTEVNSEDTDGHGTHVASTAGGNPVAAPIFDAEGTDIGLDIDISGVAPRANIVALQVCAPSCFTSDRIAALDQIISDGIVDVVNHSIGSTVPINTSPWEDSMELAWLSARAAGITIANSSGNNGPAASTLGSAGSPWLINSGAFTHDRAIDPKFLSDFGGGDSAPADIQGAGLTAGYGPAPVVFAGDFANGDAEPEQCLVPFPAGTWSSGEIVMCERGAIARVDKCRNVRDGGAAGCILANIEDGATSTNNDAHVVPAIHVDAAAGTALKAWLAGGTGHTAVISDNLVQFGSDPANGAIAADFTSRGPNLSQDYLPVTVGSPGVDIYAAFVDGIEYAFLSGTSMASPHTAGAAVLLKQVRPDWTDAELQSALATTANFDGATKEDGLTPADPFDVGGGVIRVDLAASAGLLLDETVANFEAADPNLGGDPKTLNVAGMVNRACLLSCSWTRTVEATTAGTWTVTTSDSSITAEPASFTLAAGETQAVTVTADASGLPEEWVHGTVVMTPDAGLPVQHLTVSFTPSTGSLPDAIEAVAVRDADSYLVTDLSAVEITDLQVSVSGLVAPTETVLSLDGDSDNSSPFDDLTDGVFFTTFDLDENATRLVASTSDETTTSPDLDVYVGYDVDGNGLPGDGEIVCISATATATETCDITGLIPGTWWVMVQNWQASETPPDSLVLETAIAIEDVGNLSVDAPIAVAELTPFDLRVIWDLPEAFPGDMFYGAITLGPDASNPAGVGTIPVTITRGEDDVMFAASANEAEVGDTVSFTASVAPNFTPEDRTYELSAVIPEGTSLVDGSISGDGELVGDTVVWSIAQPSLAGAEPSYNVVTSNEDPACAMPFATNGGYVDLELFGIFPDPGITGDTIAFSAFSGQNFNFFGETFTGGFNFTDDGFVYFDSTAGANPWVNTPIPDVTDPNDLIAMLWRDMVVPTPDVTPGSVVGVTLAAAGVDLTVIEYDNMELYPGGGGDSVDFGMAISGIVDDTPSVYEIVVAFDNVNVDTTVGTIGVENGAGTAGTQYAFNDVVIEDELAICYDLVSPSADPVVVGFELAVDPGSEGAELPVELVSVVDTLGTEPVSIVEIVSVGGEPSAELTGIMFGPLVINPEVPEGRMILARLRLLADGEPTVEPLVTFTIVDAEGAEVTSRDGVVLESRGIYVRNFGSRMLPAGEYTMQALVDGEVIAETPFTKL